MSSWLPFPSGLISLCIFSHHSGGHRTRSAAFIPHGDSPHLCSHHYFSICLSISISFYLWGWIAGGGATFITIATLRAWSPEDSYLRCFLDFQIPLLCHVAQDELAAWIERRKKTHGKEDSKTRYAKILIAILLRVELAWGQSTHTLYHCCALAGLIHG